MMLVLLLAQITLPASFSVLPLPGAMPLNERELAAECRMSVVPASNDLLHIEQHAADSIVWNDPSPTRWTSLGCARALLALSDAPSREGVQMPAGTSWSQGAINALLKHLATDSLNLHALNVLALMAMHERSPDPLPEIAKLLRRAAMLGTQSSVLLRGCAQTAMKIRDTATVRQCGSAALGRGVDSTWHLLRWAQVQLSRADTAGGVKYFNAAVAAAHDSLSRLELRWHLQWFLSSAEMAEWAGMPPKEMAGWVRDMMAKRDVRDGQPPGARLAAHFERLATIERSFVTNWSPLGAENARVGQPQGWGPLGGVSVFRDYHRWQTDFDDRAVIWMRYGAPYQRVSWSHLQSAARTKVRESAAEGWLYQIDNKPLKLTFDEEESDGSSGATTLRRGILDPRGMTGGWPRSAQCEIDDTSASDCDWLDIAYAVRYDDNSVRPDRLLPVAAQFHRLWDPETHLPIALVSYAVAANALQKSNGSAGTSVRLRVSQWNPSLESWRDTTIMQSLTALGGAKGDLLAGVIAVPTTPGATSFGIVVDQPSKRWGHSSDLDRTPLATGPVQVSDLILGSPGQGLSWAKGSQQIVLAPQGSFDRNKGIACFLQVQTTMAFPDAKLVVTLFRNDPAKPNSERTFQVQLTQQLASGLNTIDPQLDVAQVPKGPYRLEVRLIGKGGEILAEQSRWMELR